MAAGDPGIRKRNYSATAIETTLVNSITSAATGDTTTSVAVVSVSGFPSTVPFTLILQPDTSKEEVVTVTAIASTTLTILRGQDNTQAQSHAAGSSVRHGVSAREFKELQTHISARGYDTDSAILSGVDTHVHGISTGEGDVVGTAKAQTLSNKTFSGSFTASAATFVSPTITSPTISGSPVITGLSSAGMSTSSATPKSYVDAILGSATAASTSATSAATSATSAATSATSAATSATSSASSASAAATSASSALTSQTAAATSATSAAASATAAATSATSAATSATSSASSASAAATSASSAATSASSAGTSATASASSASAAATSASSAATSAASSAASTSAAAASATAAATSATSAAASATAAATSATSAATSASSALTSQTAAATSATSAATSASSALTSQTAAATSATSAATSATSAATTYTAYDQRYLGSKTSAPSVDNQGGALITGATYWNSTSSLMYAWSGSAWSAISTTTSYSAPTLGSQTIASGTTYTNIAGLTINSTTIPSSKTLVVTTDKLSVHAATTSAELAGVISDETGSGSLVFATGPTLTGALAAADPTVSLGLATKQYVDAVIGNTNYHAPVKAATNTNFAATYNNGTSGIGATLTSSTTGVFTFDGVTVALTDRILVRSQTNNTQNGIYTVTTLGATGVACVLTRATDADNNPDGEMANGDVVFCTNGTLNTGKTFINASTNPITIGTSAIIYSDYTTALPSQTSNSGKYLTTDGTTPSWGAAVTSVTSASTSRISIGGTTSAPTVDLVATGVTAATYTSTTLTVDAYGRITSASTGASGGAQISDIFLLMGA
jgi:hypothetical protein